MLLRKVMHRLGVMRSGASAFRTRNRAVSQLLSKTGLVVRIGADQMKIRVPPRESVSAGGVAYVGIFDNVADYCKPS